LDRDPVDEDGVTDSGVPDIDDLTETPEDVFGLGKVGRSSDDVSGDSEGGVQLEGREEGRPQDSRVEESRDGRGRWFRHGVVGCIE
jgi:hypothetical protein